MNARERAGAIIDMFWLDWCAPDANNRMPVTIDRMMIAIEQAIIAAEEAKAKEERDGCLKIIVMAIQEKLAKVKWLNCCSCVAEEIEKQIRARPESGKKEDQT